MKLIIRAAGAALVFPALISCSNGDTSSQSLDKSGIIATVERLGASQTRSDINEDLALKVAGLFEPGEYHWKSRTGENGNYTFSGVGFGNSDARIERLVLNGLHMRDSAGPYVDSIIIEGLVSEQDDGLWVQKLKKGQIHFGDEYWENFGSFDASLISPFESLRILLEQIVQIGGDSAAYYDGLSLNINLDLQADIEFIGWVPGDGEDEVTFFIDDANYVTLESTARPAEGTEPGDDGSVNTKKETLKISVAEMTGLNVNVKELNPDMAFDFEFAGMNPFETSFDKLLINDLDLMIDGLSVDIPALTSGLSGNVENRYSRGTDIPALSLSFERAPDNADIFPLYEIFQGMGMESWDFSYNSKVNLDVKKDLASVEQMKLVMKDAAEFNMGYDISGFHNYGKVMQSMRDQLAKARLSGEGVDFPAFQVKLKEALSDLSLNRMDVYLDDNSLLEKTLNTMSVNQEVSLDVARQQAKAYAMLLTLGVNDPYLSVLAEDFATNAQAFVTEGGGLKFSVDPDDGFKLGSAIIKAENEKDRSVKELYGPLNADFEHIPD